MIFTTMRIERPEGAVVARGVAVLIEAAGDGAERLESDGARPYDEVIISTTQGVPSLPLQRRDTLFDERNTDPETGALAKYRVTGAVETFDGDHQEALCERVVGG
ncbi:MAG TPA: hypothetical protein VF808_16215 [Ktedonobacterales bacterium]